MLSKTTQIIYLLFSKKSCCMKVKINPKTFRELEVWHTDDAGT